MKSVLSVESSLDHDGDELVKFHVALTTAEFSASTSAWGNVGDQLKLASALEGFPAHSSSKVTYRFGTPGTGMCELNFFCIDGLGHVGLWASFESTHPVSRSDRHQTAEIFMRCDPAKIDEFVVSLRRFVAGTQNHAELSWSGV